LIYGLLIVLGSGIPSLVYPEFGSAKHDRKQGQLLAWYWACFPGKKRSLQVQRTYWEL